MKNKHILPTDTWSSAPLKRQPNLRQRILVVDDDPLVRRLNSEVLIYSGYQVDTADDGTAAWEALQLNNYDLLVTDNEMPNLSGVELLQKILAACLTLPIIMATGNLPEEEFTRYPWLQPNLTLLKPYIFDEFLGAVKDVLRVTADTRGQVAPPPNWRSQSLPNGLRL